MKVLAGFPLRSRQEIPWLLNAVRSALFAVSPPADQAHNRRENCEVRDELFDLSSKVQDAWLGLQTRSPEVDAAVFDLAYDASDPSEESIGQRQFQAAVHQMEFLFVFLRRAGMKLEVQKQKWRTGESKEERIQVAQALAVVFEEAFDRRATLTRGPLAKSLGPWADFYERVVVLAFGGHARLNLEEVLREAHRRRRRRESR